MIFNSTALAMITSELWGTSTAAQLPTVFASDMLLREMIRCAFLEKGSICLCLFNGRWCGPFVYA